MAQKANAEITLGTQHFAQANEAIRAALETKDSVIVRDAFAQRYLGCGMQQGKSLKIHGVPGNDMACYMAGGDIEVFGNAQDQVGNTMSDGTVIIHGRCGDAAGYGMRGGRIMVRDGCGWRVGIHMKEYVGKRPVIFIGGDAGSFLGEYMAGGVVVLLGKPGRYLATGMHGGVIYLRHGLADHEVQPGLICERPGEDDKALLKTLIDEYNGCFAADGTACDATPDDFWCLHPATSRPYASMYTS